MKKTLAVAFLYAVPFVVAAQSGEPGNLIPLKNFARNLGDLFNILIPVLIALALVVFFFGLVRYIWGGGKDSTAGRKIMFAGLIALFIMVSIWGIIRLAQNALGVDSNAGNLGAPGVQLR